MSTPAERAAARACWPSVKTSLREAPEALVELSGQAAWDAVMELTWEAYALAGGVPPSLPRSEWPSRSFARERSGQGNDWRDFFDLV